MMIKEKYSMHDAEKMIPVTIPEPEEPKGCICGEILKGLKVLRIVNCLAKFVIHPILSEPAWFQVKALARRFINMQE